MGLNRMKNIEQIAKNYINIDYDKQITILHLIPKSLKDKM